MWLAKFLFLGTVIVIVNSDGEKVIKIAQGTLKGTKTATKYRNIPYFSFKGIPYAEPPQGAKKFDIARPAKPWNGVYDATYHRSVCPQIDLESGEIIGEENCLFLNVYTPNIQPKSKCIPVIVFLHAGVFQLGSGNDDYFGPDYLVEKIVLVTLNHRLGAFGFISTEDGSAPGNAGLKDQVLALQWVRDNIEFFGGCPDKVTLAGQSSGATAVHLHMMSPLSQGLFRAAIIQSSSAVTWWALSRQARKDAFGLGKILGIQTNDSKVLLDGLKQKSVEEIITATYDMYMEDEEGIVARDDMFPFGPSVESGSGQEIFLSDYPWEILKHGKMSDIPVIIGLTSEEASMFGQEYLDEDIVEFLFTYVCRVLKIDDKAVLEDIEESAEEFYNLDLEDEENDDDADPNLKAYMQILSDLLLNVETVIAAKIMAYRNKSPVFEYMFDYKSRFGVFKEFFHSELCAAHGDDLTYLFFSNKYRHKQNVNKESNHMIDMMTELWSSFATNLKPTLLPIKSENFTWEPMRAFDMDWYLKIDFWPEMKRNLFYDNVKLWLPIYRDLIGEYEQIFH